MSRIPDLTRRDGGVAHCHRIALSREPGQSQIHCDLSLVYELDKEEVGAGDLELPDCLAPSEDALVSAVRGRGRSRVQHEPETELTADLHLIRDGERELVCSGVAAVARRVVLVAEEKRPRVIWTVRLTIPQETAGLIVGTLQGHVDLRVEPRQGDLFSSSPSLRAEA